jgi:hypothetical protein
MSHTTVRLGVSDVVEWMLGRTSSTKARGAARILLRRMAAIPWTLVEGIHTSPTDPMDHILIEVDGSRFHLRLTKRQLIFEITMAASRPSADTTDEEMKRLRRILTGGLRPDQTSGPLVE